MNANVDLIDLNSGQSRGELANQVISNNTLNIGAMRPFVDEDGTPCITIYKGGNPNVSSSYITKEINSNATLRRDEWKQLDTVLIDVARQRLGGIQDLKDKNLTYNLGNAMGTTVLEWHDSSDAMEAEMTMDGINRGKGDRVVFQHNYLPIPIIHVDYEINARVLEASRRLGNPLDTTSAERAARKVLDKLESLLFTNTTYSFGEKDSRGNNSIYSYLNFPDRNQVALNLAWTDASKTPAQILADVVKMKSASLAALHYGPWVLYVPTLYDTILDNDYSVAGGSQMTIRERILKLDGIASIKVVDTMTTNNVVLVQMTSDVVRLVNGLGLQNVQWQAEGGFVTKFKVLTIQVPQLRSDQNKKTGIVHLA